MANESSTEPVVADEALAVPERWVSCEIPGCANRMSYSPGRGAPPKYCGQMVEGVRHTRLTAYRLSRGQITLPVRASTPAAGHPKRSELYGEEARPVSTARMTLELMLAQVGEQVAAHEQRMAALAEQITTAIGTVADPDAVAAEVSAAHRAARAEIDAAEAERDQALLAAREATRVAQDAEERARGAETAAEDALAELEAAHGARDQAVAEREELTTTVAQLREERDITQAQAQRVAAEADRTRERLEVTAAELATERQAVEQQRARAETAEQQATRIAGQLQQVTQELRTAWEQIERWQTQTAEYRAELAGVRSELAAAHTATEAERHHSTQRLADQQARYDELITELRTQITQLRQHTEPPPATRPDQVQQRPRPSRRAAAKDDQHNQ